MEEQCCEDIDKDLNEGLSYRTCEYCGTDDIEQQGCHYTCKNCGNQEGCSD